MDFGPQAAGCFGGLGGGGSRLYRTVGLKVFVALMEAVLDCKGSMEVVVGLMVVLCGG